MNRTSTSASNAVRYQATIAVLCASLLAACGPSASISLEASDAALQVLLGDSVTTQIELTRAGGASADVTLDAEGAPAWVSVSFTPPTFSGATVVSTMTVATDGEDPAAEATSFLLTLTAVGTGLSASDEVTVDVDLLTVSGSVTGQSGLPDTGVSISVNGEPPLPVDANGQFVGPSVAIPYDLVVVDTVNGWGHQYLGLSATDLQLQTSNPVGVGRATTVSGDLSAVVGVDQSGVVCVEGIEQVVIGCDQVDPGTSAYSINATWSGPATISTRISAWVVAVDAGGATVGFASSGQTAQNLTDGVPALADVTLGSGSAAASVDVTITPPPGFTISGSAVAYHYGEYGAVTFPQETGADSYTAILPDTAGGSATVLALASVGSQIIYGWERAEYASGDIDLVMPAAVTPISPANAAVGVNHDTEFRVNNPSGAAATFMFMGTPTFFVTTDASVASLPDLSALGLPTSATTDFYWQTVVSTRLETVDDTATEGWISDLLGVMNLLAGGPGPEAGGGIAASGQRAFTTE